jgi:hypothetical protein
MRRLASLHHGNGYACRGFDDAPLAFYLNGFIVFRHITLLAKARAMSQLT